MSSNLRALVVVLVLALVTFALVKPMCLKYMSEENYNRRRNVWAVLTVCAFLSPSFWIYAFFAFPIMYWAGRKDSNPLAVYLLLLHVVPPWTFPLPVALVNDLFDLDNYRILAFAILVPCASHLLKRKEIKVIPLQKYADRFLIAFIIYEGIALMPYENITNTIRREFLNILDVGLLFYVVSRYCNTKKILVEALAVFLLSCTLLVTIAAFEANRFWLLYTELAGYWEKPLGLYLFRGDSLRAQASAGHSLALGYMLAMGFTVWVLFASALKQKFKIIGGSVFMWIGLFAAFSRAPWITACLGYAVYQLFSPKGLRTFGKTLLFLIPIVGVILMLPIGQSILNALPFIGTVDAENIEYRQRLAERSWDLIQNHPYFGDPFFMDNLEDMRQGEGIIDLVNVYAYIAMLYGGVGLVLFLGPFVTATYAAYTKARNSRYSTPEMKKIGACLLACLLSTSFFLVTGSLGTVVEKMYYILSAMALGLAGISLSEPVEITDPGNGERT